MDQSPESGSLPPIRPDVPERGAAAASKAANPASAQKFRPGAYSIQVGEGAVLGVEEPQDSSSAPPVPQHASSVSVAAHRYEDQFIPPTAGRHRLEDRRPDAIKPELWARLHDDVRRALVPAVWAVAAMASPAALGAPAAPPAPEEAEDIPEEPEEVEPEPEPELDASPEVAEEDEDLLPLKAPQDAATLGGLAVVGAWFGGLGHRIGQFYADPQKRWRRIAGTAAVVAVAGAAAYFAFRGHGPGSHQPGGPGPAPTAPTPAPTPLPHLKPVKLELGCKGASPWNAILEYSRSKGIVIPPHDIPHVVGETLQGNNLSWSDARTLPVGYKFTFDPSLLSAYR